MTNQNIQPGAGKGILRVPYEETNIRRTVRLTSDTVSAIKRLQVQHKTRTGKRLSFAAALNTLAAGSPQYARNTRDVARRGGR